MTSPATEPDLRFPIGRLVKKTSMSPDERRAAIEAVASTPELLRNAVRGLNDEQLDTPYRPGGWTVRQLVHHVADSHLNAYTRFRLALTEDNPTIKPYEESQWAELPDAKSLPVDVSITLLDALHTRLDALLRATSDDSFSRMMNHPENGPMTMDSLLSVYAWHGRHHAAHVTGLRERMQWA